MTESKTLPSLIPSSRNHLPGLSMADTADCNAGIPLQQLFGPSLQVIDGNRERHGCFGMISPVFGRKTEEEQRSNKKVTSGSQFLCILDSLC